MDCDAALHRLNQVLVACGGVATLTEVQQEYRKRNLGKFDDEWRRKHFGYQDVGNLPEIQAFDKLIRVTSCGDWFFREKPQGSVATTDVARKGRKHEKQPLNVSEAQLKGALAACGGTARFGVFAAKFEEMFETPLDKAWFQLHYNAKSLAKLVTDPHFPPMISVDQSPAQQKSWSFRLLTEAPLPVRTEMKIKGLMQLMDAVIYFGGFCKGRQLEKYFDSKLSTPFDSDWTQKYFGAESLDTLASVPEIASKFLIWPKNEKKKSWYFQQHGGDQTTAAVSQLKKAFDACGGAAILTELKEKFREQFFTSLDDSWMKSVFGVDSYEVLGERGIFKCSVFSKPEWIFRLYDSFSAKQCLKVKTKSQMTGAEISEMVARGRREILSVFDELNGECIVIDFLREYSRQFNALFFDKQYVRRMTEIGSFLGQEVIIDSKTKKAGLPMKMTLVNKEYEGRRRMLEVLKAAGGCCSFEDLPRFYHEVFRTTVLWEMERYFGVKSLEEAIPKLSKEMLRIQRPGDSQSFFVLKPDFTGLRRMLRAQCTGYVRSVKQPIVEDEDIFNHQCIFLTRNVKAAVRQFAGQPTLQVICNYFSSFGDGKQVFAVVLKKTPPKLLQFMMPEMTGLFPLDTETAPSAALDPGDCVEESSSEEEDANDPSEAAQKMAEQTTEDLLPAIVPEGPATPSLLAPEGSEDGDSSEGKDAVTTDLVPLDAPAPTSAGSDRPGTPGLLISEGVGVDSQEGSAGSEVEEEVKECATNEEAFMDPENSLPQIKRGTRRLIRSLLCLNESLCPEEKLKSMYRSLHGVDLDEQEIDKLFGVRSLAAAAIHLRDYISLAVVTGYEEREEVVMVLIQCGGAAEGRRDVGQGGESEMAESGKSRLLAAIGACPGGTASIEELEHSYFRIHGVVLDEAELQKHFGIPSITQVISSLSGELLTTIVKRMIQRKTNRFRVLCEEVPTHLYSCAGASHATSSEA